MELAGAVWADLFLGALALVRRAVQTNGSISGATLLPGPGRNRTCGVLNQVSLHRSGRAAAFRRCRGQLMFKRASANYSLWPERARPHRAVPLTFAVGGFAVGLVCTIAAYEVISEFVDPAIMQQSVAQSVSGDAPLLAAAVAPTPSQAPALETGRRGGRPRAPAAKVTLPIIGSHAGVPSSATDGRGGEGLASGASGTPLAENSVNPPSLIREEDEPAREEPAQEAAADEAKPAATERPAKPRKKIVKQKRERPTSYAKRYYQERERPMIYAAPYRQGPVVSQTAIWY